MGKLSTIGKYVGIGLIFSGIGYGVYEKEMMDSVRQHPQVQEYQHLSAMEKRYDVTLHEQCPDQTGKSMPHEFDPCFWTYQVHGSIVEKQEEIQETIPDKLEELASREKRQKVGVALLATMGATLLIGLASNRGARDSKYLP